MTGRPTPTPHARTTREPDPTSVWGVIYSMIEGIVLAFLNKIVVVIFAALAQIQQQLNPQNPVFDIGLVINAWGISYFLLGFFAPVAAAYYWARLPGIGVYAVGWLATTIIISGSITVGAVLLFVAILTAIIVDVLMNA